MSDLEDTRRHELSELLSLMAAVDEAHDSGYRSGYDAGWADRDREGNEAPTMTTHEWAISTVVLLVVAFTCTLLAVHLLKGAT